jgi:hypothetical protein
MAQARVTTSAQTLLADFIRESRTEPRFAALIDDVQRRAVDPFTAASTLLSQISQLTNGSSA